MKISIDMLMMLQIIFGYQRRADELVIFRGLSVS